MFTLRSDSCPNGINRQNWYLPAWKVPNHKAWTAAACLPGYTAKQAFPWFFLCERLASCSKRFLLCSLPPRPLNSA